MIMSAIGTDIWDTADQFRYVYKNLSGDGSIVARVNSLVRSDGWAKAGVMIRESLHPGSKHAFVCLTPDYGVSFQQRPETGNVMSQVSTSAVVTSSWVKLTRTGSAFTAQYSADGVTWTNVTFTAPVNISMADNVLIGLAVTSHNATTSTAAEFSNLSTTGNVTGPWQTAEIGATQPQGNSAEPMYVRIEDSTGASATVLNADEADHDTCHVAGSGRSPKDLAGVNLKPGQDDVYRRRQSQHAGRRRDRHCLHRRHRFGATALPRSSHDSRLPRPSRWARSSARMSACERIFGLPTVSRHVSGAIGKLVALPLPPQRLLRECGVAVSLPRAGRRLQYRRRFPRGSSC